MGSFILQASESPLDALRIFATLVLFGGTFYTISYVVYQRYFHPLAPYPGPFLASITDLWQVCQFLSLKQPYNLTDLHAKYGQFVRYGPDKLSTTAEEAIPILYQKGGRMFPKTEFYNAYGAAHPNVFGMRDEAVCYFPPDFRYELTTIERSIPSDGVICHIASPSRTSRRWNST